MKFTVAASPLEKVSAGAIIVLHTRDGILGRSDNPKLNAHIAAYVRAVDSRVSRAEWFCTLEDSIKAATRHLLLDSTTFRAPSPGNESLKVTAAQAIARCRKHSIAHAAFAVLHENAAELAEAIMEGAVIGDWRDARFKSSPDRRPALRLDFIVPEEHKAGVKAALARRAAILEGVETARLLVNAPNNILTPAALAAEARALARKHGMTAQVLTEKQIDKQGYGLLGAVGRGSEHPPRLITLAYQPKRATLRDHIVLVGKGITFDTGGISIKPREGMRLMNGDMGGAAAVLGTMHAIAALKLPLRVSAVIPAAHNAVDGRAYSPGMILRSKSGRTVMIDNTDAEGRLVLADAFARAGEIKATIMIDFATLTGAAYRALGPAMAAVFSDDDPLATALLGAAGRTGDSAWRLPLWPEYEPQLDDVHADMMNMSTLGQVGGAIHAANFLKRFVPPGVRWAHIDIAGPSYTTSERRYYPPGATGYGVRLMAETLSRWATKKKV